MSKFYYSVIIYGILVFKLLLLSIDITVVLKRTHDIMTTSGGIASKTGRSSINCWKRVELELNSSNFRDKLFCLLAISMWKIFYIIVHEPKLLPGNGFRDIIYVKSPLIYARIK